MKTIRLLIPDNYRYAQDLATGVGQTFREPLGYYFLGLPRALGYVARAVRLPFIKQGASVASNRYVFPTLVAAGTLAALRGELVVGLDGIAPMVALGAGAFRGDKAKVIVQLYCIRAPTREGWVAEIKDWLRGAGLRRASRVLFMCERHRVEAIETLGLSPEQVRTVTVGVDTNFFTPPPQTSEATGNRDIDGLEPGSYVFACGYMLRRDDILLQALAGQDVTLVRLLKAGNCLASFEAECAKYPNRRLKIRTLSNVSGRELRALYQKAACVIETADGSWQPAGWHSITESLSCGRPLVAASGLVTEELSRLWHQQGSDAAPPFVTFDFENAAELGHLVADLLASPSRAEEMGRAARQFAERALDMDRCAEANLQVLKQVDQSWA